MFHLPKRQHLSVSKDTWPSNSIRTIPFFFCYRLVFSLLFFSSSIDFIWSVMVKLVYFYACLVYFRKFMSKFEYKEKRKLCSRTKLSIDFVVLPVYLVYKSRGSRTHSLMHKNALSVFSLFSSFFSHFMIDTHLLAAA